MEINNNKSKDDISEKSDKVDMEGVSKREKIKEIIRSIKMNKRKKYDVYIAYRQGVKKENGLKKENIEKIIPVYDRLTDLGYKVYFDIEDKDQGTNVDKNLSFLKDSRIILVFLDNSVKSLKDTDSGFYKEIQLLPKREKTEDLLVYRYNGYESVDDDFLAKRAKYTFLDEGSELYRSADLVVRDVEYKLHRYWPQTFKQWKKTKKRLLLPTGISIILVILLALIAYTQKTKAESSKESRDEVIKACFSITENANNDTMLLLFVGGSTVKNYIESIMHTSFVDDYPNSLYVHTGSKSAWTLLIEDYLTDTNRKYYPVVLSAEKINIDSLKVEAGIKDASTVTDFNFSRQIKEFNIGKADLVVELSPREKYSEYEKRKTISIDDLVSLITTDCETLYRTSKTSGTLAKYLELFRQHKDSVSIINKLVGDGSSTFSSNGKKVDDKNVFLTNQYYKTKDTNSIRLKVEDRNKPCYIDLYIYMLEVQTGNSTQNSKYVLPKPLDNFIKILKGKIEVMEKIRSL